MLDDRNDRQDDKRTEETNDIRQNGEAVAIFAALIQPSRAQFVADENAARRAQTVAQTAHQIANAGGDGIGGRRVRPELADDGGIGRKAHAPKEISPQ